MKTEQKFLFSYAIMGLLIVSLIIPVHANVQSVETNKAYYVGDETITFTGMVEDEDSGLVTIVINDPTGEFVLLAQGYPNDDNTFEIKVSTESKFLSQGVYNATAFVVNMTGGSSVLFDYYFNQASVPEYLKNPKPTSTVGESDNSSTDIQDDVTTQENNETVNDSSNVEPTPETTQNEESTPTAVFPDPEKDPQYYINRYNNEPIYREWFDKNFPGQTIYEVVGIEPPLENEKSSTSKEKSKNEDTTKNESPEIDEENSIDLGGTEFTQIMFALGGLGVLFGAVYGIKRKVDSNSSQIIKNRQQIAKNMARLDDPIGILKNRLARGEIDIRQYNKIRNALEGD